MFFFYVRVPLIYCILKKKSLSAISFQSDQQNGRRQSGREMKCCHRGTDCLCAFSLENSSASSPPHPPMLCWKAFPSSSTHEVRSMTARGHPSYRKAFRKVEQRGGYGGWGSRWTDNRRVVQQSLLPYNYLAREKGLYVLTRAAHISVVLHKTHWRGGTNGGTAFNFSSSGFITYQNCTILF